MQQQKQKSNGVAVLILIIVMMLLGFSMLRDGGYSVKDLITDIVAGFIVFGFFLLIVVILRKFSSNNSNLQNIQNQAQIQMEEIDKDFIIEPQTSDVTFKQVAGIQEVKEELVEIVDFLQNPEKYKRFGIKLPKGVL